MIKVGILFEGLDALYLKEVAQELQRFIVEEDYSLKAIIQKLQAEEMIRLEVSREENMPDLTTVVEHFNEEEIAYQLYQESSDDSWEACEIDELNLDRTPILIKLMVSIMLVGYFLFSIAEIFAIYDWFTLHYEWGGVVSALGATVVAFIPLVGSTFAYFGATELWEWSGLFTFTLYFWYYLPVVGFFLYLLWLVVWGLLLEDVWLNLKERWYDFWNPEFKNR